MVGTEPAPPPPPTPPRGGGGIPLGYPIVLTLRIPCQALFAKKITIFRTIFLDIVSVRKVEVQVLGEKKCTRDVDDSAGLGYLLCMVTTTIYNGRLVRLGCKRWIVRDIAGVQVEIGVDINGCDDYVLDILVGFDHTNVSEAQVEQIRSEIAAKQNEIMGIFGY